MSWRGLSLDGVRESLRTQLWPLPALGVLVALAIGVFLPKLDLAVDDALPSSVTAYLFGGGPPAARVVLDAVASSLITVTSLTFSLTVVTLQLASSQFSPRLLRTFVRDRVVHVTLALFLATFTYALTVQRTVRSQEPGIPSFVPQLSVTVAFLLTLASVLALVVFLAHLAREIRVETMLRTVHADASDTLQRVLERPSGTEMPVTREAALALVPSPTWPLCASSSGFLLRVDERALVAAATGADAVVLLDRHPGNQVVAGTPVAAAWPRQGMMLAPEAVGELAARVAAAVTTGPERTAEQDVGFALRQLVDVAVKALSPGVNDPTTAGHAIGHLSAVMCELCGLDLGARLLRDEHQRLRAVLLRPSFAELLELVMAQTRRYGAGDPYVLARLFALLREVAWSARSAEQQAAVAAQIDRLVATTAEQDLDDTERQHLAGVATHARQALDRHWEWGTPGW